MTVFRREEEDMHPTFEEVMGSQLDERYASYLFHEVSVGTRGSRADFAAAHVDPDRAWKRLVRYGNTEGVPDEYRAAYSWAKSGSPITKDELVSRLARRDNPEEAVDWLIEQNYLLEDSDGWLHFHLPNNILETVETFELKISDWKSGIMQAKKYRASLGDFSHVVMDAKCVHRAEDNLDEFKSDNIGLLALSRDSLEVIYDPRHQPNQYHNEGARNDLSERAFKKFTDEHQEDPSERWSDRDIEDWENPLEAMQVASRIDRLRR
ncbi:hypothetical protein [Natrinema salsiterrestre]|uniref:Uncharacterized protein n=1 Tax=Natrinema salsiterrestre TaxID=2950540 RepID=A0A9Q4L5W9_9EURY|nr:hypothetical protein [Natrinema salsiterrestre]MDF9747874.1 hypothetical protein [Natrinema salsiterrestre]